VPPIVTLPTAVILFVDDLGYNEINTGLHAPSSGGYSGYGGKVQTPAIERCAHLLPRPPPTYGPP
jgi:hypothetical protein